METKIQKLSFTGKTIYIGIDVHKQRWHVTLVIGEVTSNSKAFEPNCEKLYNYLARNYPGAKYKACYEAGYSGFWIYEKLSKLGIDTIVVHPADVPITDKARRNKTDQVDSRRLALHLKSGILRGIYVSPNDIVEARSLIRQRKSLVKDQTRIKNRIKAYLSHFGIQVSKQFSDKRSYWSKGFINWLKTILFRTKYGKQALESLIRQLELLRQEILVVTRQIREMSKQERFEKNYKLLISIPGIGTITAMTILTELVDMARFKYIDNLMSFIGLVPTEHSSGDSRRVGHMTKRSNHYLRSLIIEASWVAVRIDPALTLYYNQCYPNIGKQKAIIKIARKLVSRIRHVWVNEVEYVRGIVA